MATKAKQSAPAPRKRPGPARMPKIISRKKRKDEPFRKSQDVYVLLNEEEATLDYLPCIPKPDYENAFSPEAVTRIENKSWLNYIGLVTIGGEDVMEFDYNGSPVLLGFGALPHLKNIPQRSRRKR